MKLGGTIPRMGIALALVTAAVLIIAGTNLLLALAAALVWIASFWLVAQPPPTVVRDRDDGVRLTAAGMRDPDPRS